MTVPQNISKKVLVVGPEYRNHRGGIGAVIASHKELFEHFNFIATYNYQKNPLKRFSFFSKNLWAIILHLRRTPEIEIVHVHSSQKGSIFRKLIVLLVAKYIFRKKFINHSHGSHFQIFYNNSNAIIKRLVRFYLHRTDITLTVSNSWKKYYESTFGLPVVHKLNNMINFPEKTSNVKHDNTINLLFLGAIGDRKGIFDLVDVIITHRASLNGKLKLTVGGDGETEKLKQLIEKHNLHDIIDFKGWISGDEKITCLLGCDVYILPSYNEGMPVSILEAMSYGKAIISTNIAGIPEIVTHNVNGFLIAPGDREAIWAAIQTYVESPEKMKTHGQQSISLVREYTPEAVVPQIENIYKSLLCEN